MSVLVCMMIIIMSVVVGMEDEILAGKSPAIQYLERVQNTEDSGIVVNLPPKQVGAVVIYYKHNMVTEDSSPQTGRSGRSVL